MNLKLNLTAAALAAMTLGGCKTTMPGPSGAMGGAAESEKKPASADSGKQGECWGVNACKGQGACGGAGHECSGQNACKGQGWLSLTKPDCDAKNGKFKAS
jgi:hypothetical protein